MEHSDLENNGRDDVFITKGNVEQMPDIAMKDPNNLLVQGADGTFTDKSNVAGLAATERSRGAVMVDLNLDGLLDLAVVNRRAPLEIYQNVTEITGHWKSLLLAQDAPNVNAIGAWIEVDNGDHIQARELTIGGGHAGGTAGPEHFGLGSADQVRLRVIWPGGTISGRETAKAGQFLKVSRDGDELALISY